MAVARIGQNQFARTETKTSELLSGAFAFGGSEIEIIALQRGQAQAVVNPPQAPRPAWFANHRGVQQTHVAALKPRLQIDPAVRAYPLTHLLHPTLSITSSMNHC